VASEVHLAPLRWWQIAELIPLEEELFGSERWSPAMFWSELAQQETRWYRVALAPDGDVVGYVGLCIYGPENAWVQTIAVTSEWQGRGVGRLLLEELLAEARRRGVWRLALEVRDDNAVAQRLYAGYGFEAVGVRRGYYQPSGADAVVMVREEAA
jgi:ribosomal-protein-alanine N-acetyltransferase